MKITAYPEDTSPANNDLLLTVDVSSGTNKKVTVTNLINTIADIANLPVNGWFGSNSSVSSVTYNGNRSYSVVTGTDLSSTISAGMRLRTTRTVSAPTQCTSLNGTNQYFNKTSPAGMTFTNNFTCMAWVKLTSYGTKTGVISRFNGTSGWFLFVDTAGQVGLQGVASGSTNEYVLSYQSIPLNKWVHIAATLDVNGNAGTVYIDGVLVPSNYNVAGAGTAITQAGNLEIGSYNAANFFPGKIAQAAVFSAVLSASTIRGYISQGLAGNETSLISAYSFNNSINDLNTTNANNLTAQNSAVATNADSPFGGQADGTISSTLDYGIVQNVSGTTLTVQVAEGNTIPTSGGVSSISYSNFKAPYGMSIETNKWFIEALFNVQIITTITVSGTWVSTGQKLNIPTGKWIGMIEGILQSNTTVAATRSTFFTLSNTTPTNSSYLLPLTVRILGVSAVFLAITICRRYPIVTTTSTDYTFYATSDSLSGTETALIRGEQGTFQIIAENAYL